jgi:peptidoglycan hydrolase-like protein with peptidoglycan-binding domain
MRKKIRLCFLGTLLLACTAVSANASARPSAPQTSAKKKTVSSKSKRKRRAARPKGQTVPTPDRIKDIQTALQKDGSYEGEPTGKWDNNTIEAMKKYQDKNGFSPTGKIDALSLKKLGLGSDTAGKGAPTPASPSSASPTSKTSQ